MTHQQLETCGSVTTTLLNTQKGSFYLLDCVTWVFPLHSFLPLHLLMIAAEIKINEKYNEKEKEAKKTGLSNTTSPPE